MSYIKIECVRIVCDSCKEIFTTYHNEFSIFIDESQAHEAADNDEWFSEHDKHYCPSCYEIDDSDNLIIKPPKQ